MACPQASIVSTLTKHSSYSGYDLSYVLHTLCYFCPLRTSWRTEPKTMFVPCYLQKNRKKIHIVRILIVDYLLIPSVSMFIGQGLSLEACHPAQAERRSANTATAPASAAGHGGDRAGFIRVSTIIHSLPTCRNGFHCLSSNRHVRIWSVPC